jgi:hypothetical protein
MASCGRHVFVVRKNDDFFVLFEYLFCSWLIFRAYSLSVKIEKLITK